MLFQGPHAVQAPVQEFLCFVGDLAHALIVRRAFDLSAGGDRPLGALAPGWGISATALPPSAGASRRFRCLKSLLGLRLADRL